MLSDISDKLVWKVAHSLVNDRRVLREANEALAEENTQLRDVVKALAYFIGTGPERALFVETLTPLTESRLVARNALAWIKWVEDQAS